jgi:hypothetical protein
MHDFFEYLRESEKMEIVLAPKLGSWVDKVHEKQWQRDLALLSL